jgi:hypothetical protein
LRRHRTPGRAAPAGTLHRPCRSSDPVLLLAGTVLMTLRYEQI